MKNIQIDTQILEELSNLEFFIVKSQLGTSEFWKEWQEKFSRAYMGKVAIKKVLKVKKPSYEDVSRYKMQLKVYDDILLYLETLKNIAMSLKGIASFGSSPEFDDEDIDFDF